MGKINLHFGFRFPTLSTFNNRSKFASQFELFFFAFSITKKYSLITKSVKFISLLEIANCTRIRTCYKTSQYNQNRCFSKLYVYLRFGQGFIQNLVNFVSRKKNGSHTNLKHIRKIAVWICRHKAFLILKGYNHRSLNVSKCCVTCLICDFLWDIFN